MQHINQLCHVSSSVSVCNISSIMRAFFAVCCSVLQSVAGCCRVLQCMYPLPWVSVDTFYNARIFCSVLQCVAVCCSVLQCVAMTTQVIELLGGQISCELAVCCSVLQCVAACCSVLQCVAVCCSVL